MRNHIFRLYSERTLLLEVVGGALEVPTSLKTPISDERGTDYLVDVTHRLYQAIEKTMLGNHDGVICLCYRPVNRNSLHCEFLEQIHRAGQLCNRHVAVLVDYQGCQDQVDVLLEVSAVVQVRKVYIRVVIRRAHLFITVVEDFDQFSAL